MCIVFVALPRKLTQCHFKVRKHFRQPLLGKQSPLKIMPEEKSTINDIGLSIKSFGTKLYNNWIMYKFETSLIIKNIWNLKVY